MYVVCMEYETLTHQVESSTLLAAASIQMEETRQASAETTASAGCNVGVAKASASASVGSSSSCGTVEFHSTVDKKGSETADLRAMFQSYVRVRL